MATFDYNDLITKYDSFQFPISQILVDGKDIADSNNNLMVTDIEIENTCDYEASIASFTIFNSYSRDLMVFKYEATKAYTQIGSSVVINLGYATSVREVFRGFISNVSYDIHPVVGGGIKITCMDIKGIMMAGNYSAQLTATAYSDAVKEILKRTVYEKLKSQEVILSYDGIKDTPDKKSGSGNDKKASDLYLEMVSESDYEFVVKAAKKFNYEFYSLGGNVHFRPAKSNKDLLIILNTNSGLRDISMEFDITGLVGSVEVRNMDVGTNDIYKEKRKMNNLEGKAKTLVSSIEKVYIDPTIRSKEDAQYRADYLANDISYRFGTLKAEFFGLPELSPGYYVRMYLIADDKPVDFYITHVRHVFDNDGYNTWVVGKAAKMGTI